MATKVKADRDRQQRLKNLARANEARLNKAQLRRDLGQMAQVDACRLMADRLVNDPFVTARLSLEKMLTSINGVGMVRATRIARSAESRLSRASGLPPRQIISWNETIGDMTKERREALAKALTDYASVVESWDGGGRGAKA